ncbi:hypothetical protein HY798_00890 [Candidatus Falkowbacteria bacterium]|nr:hypothetical protein [Candidatus Falkowbacteria bacterium]
MVIISKYLELRNDDFLLSSVERRIEVGWCFNFHGTAVGIKKWNGSVSDHDIS